uniref:SSD domain-containing protein n=1 Tax=Dracunculus medinensis TaxID=318479 RepID=A0A158Q5K9_DRAME
LSKKTTIDPQYVFSPENAPWRYEYEVLRQHWPLDEQNFWPGKSYDYNGYVDIIAAGIADKFKGRPNMLLENYLNELSRINQYIIYNLTVPFDHSGKHYEVGFTDICLSYEWKCYHNDHITMLMPKHRWGNFSGRLAEFTDDIIKNEVKITYPIGWRGTEPIYFGALIGAPNLIDEEGHFNYVRAIRLTYNVRNGKVGDISYRWRKKVTSYLANKENPPSRILEFGLYHNESLPEGLQQVADELIPTFICTFAILFALCALNAIVFLDHSNYLAVDWVRSKPVTTIKFILPIMTLLTDFFLYLTGYIIQGIGIDDMFIMTAVWHRTNPNLSASKRLAVTLSEAATAVSITSITDLLSFGIGCFTSLPSVQLFCLYTTSGIFFTYIYQLTFFTAIMAFSGDWEAKGLHVITFKPAFDPNKASYRKRRNILYSPKQKNCIKLFLIIIQTNFSKDSSWHDDRDTLISKIFRQFYGPFLLDNLTKKIVIFIYMIYTSLSILGCINVKEGLNPKFLVKETFYLNKFYVLMDETFWNEGLQMQLVVNSPPDFFNLSQKANFKSMISEFENTHYTMKHNATMFWLDAFELELKKQREEFKIPSPTTEEWYEKCQEWLIVAGGRRLWEKDMRWCTNQLKPFNHLCAFRLQLGLRNYRTPTDHMRSAQMMRKIAAKYPQFNISTFHEYYPFADQYIELKPALIRNCILALLSMFIVSFIMIPNCWAAFIIAGAILNIDIGVIGFMTFWEIRLESVSMITIIMSIGFAVDLSAHIGYAYVKADGDKNQKAIQALENIGWPGAFSTMIGISLLASIDAYIVQIFFKTIFLVITFSLIHGLVFLPVFLTIFLPHTYIHKKFDTIRDIEFHIKSENFN